ncbi:MAG TPA: hypothetical protein PKM57_02335 [Kiritimatiellia bacterium]|nr:hypothetical protein [Kiritimatiellia bacterium]HPS08004.1 hypothetical protein [Kiritimatiellia bacterium]
MNACSLVCRGLVAVAVGNALFSAAATYTANTPGAVMQSVTLTNGDQLTSSTIDVPTLPASVGTPIFHLDASSTSGWEFAESGGTNHVTKCLSATGDGRYLTFDSKEGRWLNGPFLTAGAPELKGGQVLDFGKQGSRLGLYFDGGKLDNIGTIVAVWGSQNGGGWILGGGVWTNTVGWEHAGYGFHRGSHPLDSGSAGDSKIIAASRIIKDGVTYPSYNQSRCWLDGTEVNPLTMGFSGNYQLLSIICTNLVPWAAGLGINDTRDTSRSGGQRVAEMILYGKLLTDAERMSVEAYLTEKWFGRPYAGYNHQAALATARLTQTNSVAVPQDETLAITRIWDGNHAGQTVKGGNGTLALPDAAGFGGQLVWQAGGLSFPRRAVPAALPADPVFRVDASAASSLDTVVDGNGVTRVTAWRDAEGRGFAAAPLAETNRPSLLANALNGKAVVDFGAYVSGQFLQWNTNMSYIGTVLWVVGSQNGGGHLMGHSWDNGCHFQRGGAGGAQTSPIWSSAGWKVAMRACPTYVNGLRVNGTNAYLGYAYQVVAVQAPGAFANQFAGHLSTSSDYSRTGGQRLAEVVAYNRLLSDQELADAQAYLMRKWLNADAPGYARQSRSRPDLQDVSVTCEGPLTVGRDAVRLGAVSGAGTIVKRGAGDLEVQDSSLFSGSITLESGNLKTASPAVVDGTPAEEPAFQLDATRADALETITQNGTNFIAQWTDVSGWRNAARRWDTSASRPLPWLRNDVDLANGHPVVDFGPRASCRALVFEKAVKNIRAAYIVIGTQDGDGGFLLGSTGSEGTYDFHRGGVDTNLLSRPIIAGHPPCKPLRDGAIYIDGVATNYNAGLSGGYQVVELHPAAGVSASGLACDRYGGTTAVGDLTSENARRTGAQRLAEVILYDRPLSERERVATRNYLMKKWLNRDPAALPADPTNALRQIAVSASSNVTFSAGNAASVLSLTGAGDFEKTGAASLAIVDASAFTGTLRVAEGTLLLTGLTPPVTPALATNGLAFHADATKHVEWALEGGVRRVSRWGSAVGDGWFAYPQVNKPEYRLADLGGLPVVDLGAMGSLQHLLFCNTNSAVGATNRIANIRSVFWVMGSQNGGGYLLGGGTNASSAAAHYNFHRGPKMGSNDVVNPITPDHYLWGGPTDPKIKDATSITYLNGVATNGSQTVLSGGYDLIGLVMNQYATEAEGFAFDGRYLDSKAYDIRSGGQRLAEVLIYNRPLSDAERRGVECYLQRKWALLPYRANDGSAMTLAVAAGASVDLAGSTQPVAHLTGAGSVTGGTLQVLEGISVGDAEGETATLAVSGGLTLADGAVIDVDITHPTADKVTVSGTCTLGAHVSVRLRNAASVRGQSLYQTPLIEAAALSGAANVSGWTVTGDLPKGYGATLYTADGQVWLRLSLQGFLMLVK